MFSLTLQYNIVQGSVSLFLYPRGISPPWLSSTSVKLSRWWLKCSMKLVSQRCTQSLSSTQAKSAMHEVVKYSLVSPTSQWNIKPVSDMSDAKLCFKMRHPIINALQNFLLFVVVCCFFSQIGSNITLYRLKHSIF